MPWCDDCEKYYAPSAMTPAGRCPTCDADLEAPEAPQTPDGDDEKVPWHFKLMVVALVVYLGWRVVQLVSGQL